MTDFLDDLARTMAKPMPRSRAVRALGGALVAVAVGGPLWPRAASGGRHRPAVGTQPCQKDCSGPLPVPCICPGPNPAYCFETCGVAGSTCCCLKNSSGQPTGAVACPPGTRCGRPGESNCPCVTRCGQRCCSSGEYCGNAKQSLCCKTGRQACGDTCCEQWEKCASPKRSVCCNRREQPCLTKTTATCCSPGEKCCQGLCCTPNQICSKEGCECKPGTSRGRCGGDCCHPTRDKCCPGGRTGKFCTRKTRVCCGASSCPPGGRCCSEIQQTCARAGQRCCGATPYDPAARKCCGGDYLCGKDDTCCIGSLCCGPNEDCTPQGCSPAQPASPAVFIRGRDT